ncbi:DUF5666 domain-containing protein [Geobacter sp.]|uniref:DUF5666 domain-containing protein n=1 Tax=Geobacter sp. TaxID=46610 RepID=UPI00262FD247|nr:DUF5666 domain-containing protein [Geobacter sp.]
MRVKQWFFVLFAAIFALSLAGCGGGGGTAPAAGTPVVSRGAITQLGSVYVNGIKFNTNNAAINMEDPTDVSGGLKVGMVVTVKGTLDDASNGTASSVDFADNLKGPIATFSNVSSSMTVLGQRIKFDPAKTVFDNFSGVGTMGVKPGQMVQVSGMPDASGTIMATRIERHLPDWTPGSVVELKGTISAISGTTLTINGLQVDASGVTLPAGATVGTFVRVEGTIPALTGAPLKATEVKLFKEGVEMEEGKHAEVEGLVSGLSGTTFMVGGTPVDAGTLSLAGVANGVKVEVEGTFVNNVLKATKISVEETPAPTTAPAAPSVVSAVGGFNQVTISWNAVSGATSYNIYWSTTSGVTTATGTKITGATSPFVQTGLTANTTYYYIVTAVNSVGESPPSSQVSATTTSAPTVPAAPIGVGAMGGTNQVTISWAAVTGATSYNIYWATTTGVTPATGTKISGATSPYVQTGLTGGTTYFYVVTAENAAGESAPSAQVSATPTSAPTPPSAPTGVTATGGTNSVTVSWTAVTGATSYNLYWSTTTGVTTATGTKITGVTSPYRQTLLNANTTYFYIVTAMNAVGESVASSQVSATTSALDGVALYGTNCAGCHNPLATSSKKNRTAAQIQAAINGNVGGMGFLSTLTAAQVQAIADVLAF